jgi:LPXTG-motif cell wall-anchored protein
LAFTGPGTGVVWILIAGSLLMLIGIAGRRRQLRRRSALPS